MTDRPAEAEQGQVSARLEVAAGSILAAAAAFALLWLIPSHTEPSLSEHDIAPGFFPSLAAWAVLILSALFIATRLQALRQETPAGDSLSLAAEVAVWGLAGLLTVLGLSTVGFLVTAPLLIVFWMFVGGRRIWWQVLLLALLFPLVLEQLAWIVFTVRLP